MAKKKATKKKATKKKATKKKATRKKATRKKATRKTATRKKATRTKATRKKATRRSLGLPSPRQLWKRCVSLAALDAALSPDWEYRYYSFNAAWGDGQHMASMRNGSGDGYFIGFCDGGVFLKGFDHESKMSPHRKTPPELWEGMYDGCPPGLAAWKDDEGIEPEQATFCWWWNADSPGWQSGITRYPEGSDPDGSQRLLAPLLDGPERYVDYARDYFETEVTLQAVTKIYEHDALSIELLGSLRPGASDLAEALEEITEMTYGGAYPFLPQAEATSPESEGPRLNVPEGSYSRSREFQRLWDELVPPSHQADTVQGELIRCVGRLRYEANNNGNVNWDRGFRIMTAFISDTIGTPNHYSWAEFREFRDAMKEVRDGGRVVPEETTFEVLERFAVEWCFRNPVLLAREQDPELLR